MPKEDSPYVVGDHWLDRRRDGRSPDVWQIARYDAGRRTVVYTSTRTGDLDAAKAAIHAHVQAERARGPQSAEDAEVVPHLFLYWREHGSRALSPDVIAGSLRAFLGFLLQDKVGVHVRFSELRRPVFARFIAWRMRPHSFTVDWEGREYATVSKGVKGESVQRNIDDVRAALNHAVSEERVPTAPTVPGVPKEHRSPPRDVRMSLQEVGAMIGFASQPDRAGEERTDKGFGRWLWLMTGTACRPEAALAFDPAKQWDGSLIDLHPPGWHRTKKHNPIVPAPGALARLLDAWRAELGDGQTPIQVASRRTAWRTMRRALGLPPAYIPKVIRHTIATELRRRGAPPEQISVLLGHRPADLAPMTAVYAKYDPAYLKETVSILEGILGEINAHALAWVAGHRRTKTGNGRVEIAAVDPPDRR